MSDQTDQKPEIELGIDNNSHKPELTTTGKRSPTLIDTTGVENASAILKAITQLHEIAEVNKKNEDRKLREISYNAQSLDDKKKKTFMKYLQETDLMKKEITDDSGNNKLVYLKKPERIKYIFEHNIIDSAGKGFTLTTMAMAWLELYGLLDSVPLEKMKKRIRSMICSAVKDYGATIYGTPITKFKYIYYITKNPDDYEKQANGLQDTSEMFGKVAKNRDARGEQLKKEREQADRPVIEVTNSGQQQTSTVQPEPEPEQEQNEEEQNAQEGGGE